MKHYIIWLKSGECITGDISDETVNRLCLDGKSVLKFEDTEGSIVVKRNRIEAIGINNAIETNKCGFKKAGD
ncbi:MAG TPA: hypothetical protein VN258_06340 [Mobilitalea sp.]|nr:hypothetical protein [Mobilitalea sp.]